MLILIAVGMHQHTPLVSPGCIQQELFDYGCAAFDRFIIRPIGDGLRYIGLVAHDFWDDLVAWATLAITVFTGTLWWVTWGNRLRSWRS